MRVTGNTSSGAALSFAREIFGNFDCFLGFVDNIMEITDSVLTITVYLWARARGKPKLTDSAYGQRVVLNFYISCLLFENISSTFTNFLFCMSSKNLMKTALFLVSQVVPINNHEIVIFSKDFTGGKRHTLNSLMMSLG